ncbi:MAG: hypothetical protein PHE20_04250 [Patescibacteria group bacterium]|nr:hypothetical protein [Patescibacteria group bacterium]
MKMNWKLSILIIFLLLFIIFALFFLIPATCDNDFKAYPEKGYCEFNLKTCEGLFGCKEYENIQVPCGSVSTLCGEKVLCDCGDDKEPLSYSAGEIEVAKESRPFSYSSEQLKVMSDECGVEHDIAYFDSLTTKFRDSIETIYSFKYQGSDQDSRAFVVTLLPNEAEYLSLEEFKKDFDLCAAGGDLYPMQLNKDWLLFVNSCGSGAGNSFDDSFSCDELREIVEPSLKLN